VRKIRGFNPLQIVMCPILRHLLISAYPKQGIFAPKPTFLEESKTNSLFPIEKYPKLCLIMRHWYENYRGYTKKANLPQILKVKQMNELSPNPPESATHTDEIIIALTTIIGVHQEANARIMKRLSTLVSFEPIPVDDKKGSEPQSQFDRINMLLNDVRELSEVSLNLASKIELI